MVEKTPLKIENETVRVSIAGKEVEITPLKFGEKKKIWKTHRKIMRLGAELLDRFGEKIPPSRMILLLDELAPEDIEAVARIYGIDLNTATDLEIAMLILGYIIANFQGGGNKK